MIKGILLAVFIASFVVSLIIFTTSSTGILKENMTTGAFLGVSQIKSYSFMAMCLSFLGKMFVIVWILKAK